LVADAFSLIVQDIYAQQPENAAVMQDLIQATNRGQLSSQEFTEHAAELIGISVAELRQRVNNGEIKNYDLLAYIKDLRKIYKTAVLSNVSRDGFWRRFTANELEPYFDSIILSGEIGYAKPEARAYEVAADTLGIRLDACLMIDDREDYCQGAQGVGMQAVLYTSLPNLQQDLVRILQTTL
jgi:HAD superfamily hydrolase (TIGR01509 family)